MSNRRSFFTKAAAGLGAAMFSKGAAQAPKPKPAIPVVTPDLPDLPFKLVDGVKEFHLIAEPVRTEIAPGRVMDAWGFNGSVPGPTMQVNQGDRVRVIFENKLPEMTAVHWHGFEVPMEMDGSVGLGQDPVQPGEKFIYEFTLNQAGTFFYHSHFAMQEMMGMIGLFILHPKEGYDPPVQRDFGLILQEWALLPNNTVPNTLSMEFNWLTINGKAGPAATPMIVKKGERVRIRMVNLGMDHHPMHLHGNTFVVTGTEAGRSPAVTWQDQNTVLVGVAQARDVEFDAKFPGDWMLHCHLPHHMMNQMVSMVGPFTHGMHEHGLSTGAGMEEGMGMLRQGGALSSEAGPSMGRGLGLAADADRSTSNLVAQNMQPASAEVYTCPHHPEVTGKKGDKCPKCRMELQPKQAPAAEVYTCPHHPEVTGKKGDKCPKCGMELQPKQTGAAPSHAGHDPATDMYPKDDPEKKKVPGYPQDMWMPVDELFAGKPELYGLRKGWSGAMMGMMTMVRVVSNEVYDKIMALKKTAQPAGHEHHGE
jgi:hypothetical protein